MARTARRSKVICWLTPPGTCSVQPGSGGANGVGTVFEIARTSNGWASMPTVLVSFNVTDGATPDGLVADAAGDLFGVTNVGGISGGGTVYEVANTGAGYASSRPRH